MNWDSFDKEQAGRQRFQADYYDKFATDFDAKCRRENSNHLYKIEQIAETFFSNLPSDRESYDFLELGSGTGIHAHHFLKRNAPRINRLTLTDISVNMLGQAEKRLAEFKDKTRYLVMPAEKFSMQGKFDGIYVSGSMHHFANPSTALVEIRGHLKPGGMAVICEPVVWNPVNLIKALREIRAERGQFRTQRSQVRRYLHQQGFEIVTDRVLHYRSGSPLLSRFLPYRRLERSAFFNPLAVMFLFGAKVISQTENENGHEDSGHSTGPVGSAFRQELHGGLRGRQHPDVSDCQGTGIGRRG